MTRTPVNIPRCPGRDEIRSSIESILVEGKGGKADVLVLRTGEGRVVVKDFAGRGLWGRCVGRIQIRRESAVYGRLRGVAGVPAFVGRIDPLALAIEWIDGERLAFLSVPEGDVPPILAKLRATIDAMHARGVVHNDLRGRENVLLRRDGGVAVVDLAAAIHLTPGGLAHRLFFRFLATADEAAYLKWKGMLAPGSYTPREASFLRRFERWRRLWPFNPKRRKAGPGSA